MRNICRVTLLLVIAFAAMPVRLVLSKGQVSKVTISGPGLNGAVEVVDSAKLASLSLGELEQFGIPLTVFPPLGEGYEIARYLEEPGSKPFIFDRIHYFPALSDEVGYIYYDGLEGNGWSEYDGKWFRASVRGDAAVRRLLPQLVSPRNADAQAKLGQVPSTCNAAQLENASTGNQQAVKISDRLWVSGFQGSAAVLKLDGASAKRTEHGWATDLHWRTKRTTKLLTIWGRHIDDGSQLWFSLDEQQPSAVLTFNPSARKDKQDWAEFQTKVYVPKAGCYEILVYEQGIKVPARFAIAAGS